MWGALGVLAGVVVTSGLLNIRMSRQNQRRIRELTLSTGSCEAKRDGRWIAVDNASLVPGDVIALPAGKCSHIICVFWKAFNAGNVLEKLLWKASKSGCTYRSYPL